MAVKIKDRKTSDWKKLEKELKELCGMEVRVGFQRDKKYYPSRKTKKENQEDEQEKKDEQKQKKKKIDVCDVAACNELGTEHIPSRPFLRKSVDENKEEIEAFLKLQAKRVMNGVSAADVLKKTGEFQASLIREKIENGSYKENADATIQRKGSDKPLIDTGRMRQSVHYFIEKKGNRKE